MKKYAALRTIASIFKILGIISGVITILLALSACLFTGFLGTSMSGMMYDLTGSSDSSITGIIGGIISGLIILVYGGFSALLIYGSGELIYVLLDMEQNTRETAELLRVTSQTSENT